MNFRQAFVAAYYFLDHCYAETKNTELVGLVSDMNPFVFADGGSADPAAISDWGNIAKNISETGDFDTEQAFQAMYEYVNFHKTEFGFDYDWVLAYLANETHKSLKWLECVSKSMNSENVS